MEIASFNAKERMKGSSGQAKNKQTEEIPDKLNCVISRNRNQTSDKQSLLNLGQNHNLFIIFWKFFIDDLFNTRNTAGILIFYFYKKKTLDDKQSLHLFWSKRPAEVWE